MSKISRKCLSLALVFMLLASVTLNGALDASADNKTVDGLAAYAMRAYNEGWRYVWGGASEGAVDCSGLIYSYVGGGARVTEDMLYSSPESGNVSDGVPDIPGLGLWQPGHVGVYVGGGMAVDARDEISNVCYQSVSTKSWVMWFKVAGVSYGDDAGVTNDDQSEKTVESKPARQEKKDEFEALRFGSTGSNVNRLQERLKELGYFDDDTTEYFGNVTKGALEAFQKAAGISVTGVYDETTRSALEAGSAPSYQAPEPEEEPETDSDSEQLTHAEQASEKPEEQSEESDLAEQSIEDDKKKAESTNAKEESEPEADTDYEERVFAQFDEYDGDGQSSANGPEDDSYESESDAVYELGDEDDEIGDLQYILIRLGYFDYDVTGTYCENTASAVRSYRADNDLGEGDVLNAETINALYEDYFGIAKFTSAAKSPLGVSIAAQNEEDSTDENAASSDVSESAADSENEDEQEQPAPTGREQSVTISLNAQAQSESSKEAAASVPEEANEAKAPERSEKESKSAPASNTSVEYVRSPQTSDSTVVFVQTGVEDYFTKTTAIYLIIASLAVIFFAGTIRYWNVSMEKRRQRARRATTVSVYRRGSF